MSYETELLRRELIARIIKLEERTDELERARVLPRTTALSAADVKALEHAVDLIKEDIKHCGEPDCVTGSCGRGHRALAVLSKLIAATTEKP